MRVLFISSSIQREREMCASPVWVGATWWIRCVTRPVVRRRRRISTPVGTGRDVDRLRSPERVPTD